MPVQYSVIVATTDQEFEKEAARLFLESSVKAVRDHGAFYAALSGGSTPKKIYALLADDYFRSRVPWADVHLFWGDERCVPPDHPESNYRMVKEALLSRVSIPEGHVHRMPGEVSPPREGARSYENHLKSFFKISVSLPPLDLIFLGVGEDGHTASLFPHTAALNEMNHYVASLFVENLSSHRLTLTLPVINHAKRVVFLASGAAKAGVIRDIFREDLPVNRYPAQRVRPENGELIWLIDKAAAAKLPKEMEQTIRRI